MSGLRERGKADRRARILAAARQGLAERGYEAMTMAQVANDAEVAVGTVFQYAATKAELLMMVTAERWVGWVMSAAIPRAGLAPVDQIIELVQPVVDEAIAYPENSSAVARELLFGAEGPHRAKVMAAIADLEQTVAKVLVSAEADPSRAQIGSRMIVSGVVLEANRTHRHAADPDSLAMRVRQVVEVTMAGVLAS